MPQLKIITANLQSEVAAGSWSAITDKSRRLKDASCKCLQRIERKREFHLCQQNFSFLL